MAYDISGESATVQVTTLDDICRALSPAVIKIDVEGAELLALRGAEKTLIKTPAYSDRRRASRAHAACWERRRNSS